MASPIERVVVINDDSVRSGGAAAIALSSIQELRACGLAVTMITGDDGTNPELAQLGVEVVPLGGRHILENNRPAILQGLYNRHTAAAIGDWIAKNDTPRTVYHLHNWHKYLSPSAFVPLRRVAARLLMTAHDYFLACPNGGYLHYPRGKSCHRVPLGVACIAASCDKRNYAHKLWRVARGTVRHLALNLRGASATVIAVHDEMIPLLAHIVDPRSIRVLRNPATPWVQSRVTAERNHQLLFVGRLEQDKGVESLARAARIAGAPLRIVGSGPLASVLISKYPEVEMTGWKPKSEIAALCRDARVLVMPSQGRETFGLVAIEAAMSGIPILASRLAHITCDLERCGVGIACDGNDINALAQAIKLLMIDDARVEQMSRRGFADARSLAPTPAEWATQLIDLYEEKLAAASTRSAEAKADARASYAPAAAYPTVSMRQGAE